MAENDFKAKDAREQYKNLVRIANTDLDGGKPLFYVLTKIRGIGFTYSKVLCHFAKIDAQTTAGALTPAQIERIEDIIKNPAKYSIPAWLYNRRKDYETGEDMHLVTSELDFVRSNDVRRMKKIRCYKGVRHSLGQPVRGQRTKSNFRRNKGKPMGVMRSKAMKAAVAEKDNAKK
jgi:small subunit ribosomal protein S13